MFDNRIREYFIAEKRLPAPVANKLTVNLLKYNDIAEEFLYYIENESYKEFDAIVVNGYSAKGIQELAPHLDVCGVYSFLVTLRDNPQKAEGIINNNFPRK